MLDRIHRRLVLGYVATVGAIVLLFGTVTMVGFQAATDRDRDHLLTEKARALIVGVSGGGDTSEFGTVVLDRDGRVAERDRTAPSLGLPDRDLAARSRASLEPQLATVDGVRVASVATGDGRIGQVARPERLDAPVTDRLLTVLGIGGAVALILATLGGAVLSGRALRPARSAFARQREFVADASHELKTPLTLVRTDAEVLLREPQAEDAPAILTHQIAEVDRMSGIVDELLTLARLDAGRLPVRQAPFDAGAVLVDGVTRFGPRAHAADVRLTAAPATPVAARGDAGRTAQILAAVLDNAVRVTPPGGLVTAGASHEDGHVVIDVADSGPGIPAGDRDRVFNRFHRLPTVQRPDRGTGLGLAIARDLARAQGGDLAAHEAPGGGALLRLRLPAMPD